MMAASRNDTSKAIQRGSSHATDHTAAKKRMNEPKNAEQTRSSPAKKRQRKIRPDIVFSELSLFGRLEDGKEVKVNLDDNVKAEGNTYFATIKCFEQGGVDLNGNHPVTGFTLVIDATIRGEVDALRFLLDKGANVNKPDLVGRTAMHFACYCDKSPNHKHVDIARVLMSFGANLSVIHGMYSTVAMNVEIQKELRRRNDENQKQVDETETDSFYSSWDEWCKLVENSTTDD